MPYGHAALSGGPLRCSMWRATKMEPSAQRLASLVSLRLIQNDQFKVQDYF